MEYHLYLFRLTQLMFILNTASLFIIVGWISCAARGMMVLCKCEWIENIIISTSILVTEVFLIGLLYAR